MNKERTILPKTSLGQWSVGLVVSFPFWLVLFTNYKSSITGFNPVLAIVFNFILAGIMGICFFTGLLSMIKSKEWSILVFVSTGIGLVLLIIRAVIAVQTMIRLA